MDLVDAADQYGSWNPGHRLSEGELEIFASIEKTEEVIAAATSPRPGGYYSDPYAGNTLLINQHGHVFADTCDDAGDSEHLTITYLGIAKNGDDLVRFAAEIIRDYDHQAAAAISFHFDAAKFEKYDNDIAMAIPEFHWFRWSHEDESFGPKLDAFLMGESELYRKISQFLENPDSPEFSGWLSELLREGSFDSAFALYS